MSTNFEMYDSRRREIRHLGQCAGGWQFQFRAWPEAGITDTRSWLRQLDDAEWIRDEFGRDYTPDEFLEAVERCAEGVPRPLYRSAWRDEFGNTFCSEEFC